uniref:Fc receptor, IgE, high affinity I, gamma polypeptide like n=1 Tax=Mola mola TaxID=94237 RepID=A0A3Q3WM43_MOLML
MSYALKLCILSAMLSFVPSAALSESEICYVLDGILFLYGIILTALYCKIKVGMLHICSYRNTNGLAPHPQETYETIGLKK